MKNMRVSMKLILSFVIVALLAAVVGVAGIMGMTQMDSAATNMYAIQTVPIGNISKIVEMLQRMRVNNREYIIGVAMDEPGRITDAYNNIETYKKTMTHELDEFDTTIINPDVRTLFDDARKLYESDYLSSLDRAYTMAKAGDADGLVEELKTAVTVTNTIVEKFDECFSLKLEAASDENDSTTTLARTMLILIIGVLIVAMAVALFLAFYISGLISKPVSFMKDVLLKIGMKGELEFTEAEYRQIEEYSKVKDEVGESVSMLLTTVRRLVKVGEALETVANNDLTAELELLSDKDTMGNSLRTMVENLNAMFGDINISTAQVATGAKQIADGAQALAQGSTEQAAAVQQLSSSISEIAEKTRENAGMATNAANLAGTIKQYAEKGSRQMDEMITAVNEINQASQNINKVIKAIDDIAFQTNILALNAAVEAARAGQHGKGFAVVAEEVRNLAAKSSEAAKETGTLIANSIEKAELGASIADETAASLADIVSGINESTTLVGDIAKSSEEQSVAISQINKGIDQVAQVVQQNSATAEESAAASEEMSSQSSLLDELIAQFKLKDSDRRPSLGGGSRGTHKRLESRSDSTSYSSSNSGEFGKY